MTTLLDVDRLVTDGRFEDARDLLDTMPDGEVKSEYLEMFYRVWSYTEKVGLKTMGGKHGST